MFEVFTCHEKNMYKKLSLPFETIQEAMTFIQTMREGRYYSMRPHIKFVILQEVKC